jgi:hypothetical protein
VTHFFAHTLSSFSLVSAYAQVQIWAGEVSDGSYSFKKKKEGERKRGKEERELEFKKEPKINCRFFLKEKFGKKKCRENVV